MKKFILILLSILLLNISGVMANQIDSSILVEDWNKLTYIRVSHYIHYTFNIYREDESTADFYIDTKNKKVYTKDKKEVDYIKDFTDEQISFMTIAYTDHYKVCRCYDINRLSGDVEFTLFQHPTDFTGKMSNFELKIKDGYSGFGKGRAEKIDISKQRF